MQAALYYARKRRRLRQSGGNSLPTVISSPAIISGFGYTGQTLRAIPGTYADAATISGQWYANSVELVGETGLAFEVTAITEGMMFEYVETATNGVGSIEEGSNIVHNWVPSDSITISAHYDAADTSTLTTFAGKVSQWNDKSGNNRHLAQSIIAQQPTIAISGIGGLPSVDWGSSTNNRALFFSERQYNPQEVYIVSEVTGIMGNYAGMYGAALPEGDRGGIGLIQNSTTGNWSDFHRGWDVFRANGAITSYRVIEQVPIIYNVFRAIPRIVDGFTLGRDRNIGADNTYTTRGFVGKIAEVLVLSQLATNTEREKLDGYLAHKWGIVASLPTAHPYKTEAPSV